MDQVLRFLANPDGIVIYPMVLGLLVFGALLGSFYARGYKPSIEGKRIQKGLLYLLLIQILLFILAWLAWMAIIDSHFFLPPLDRTLALVSLILIVWLWAFPTRNPIVDAIIALIEIFILIAGIFIFVWWLGQNPSVHFHNSLMGAYSYYSGIIIITLGLILLLWKRPKAWEYGILMLVILFVGYLAQFFIRQPAGDYAWFVRIGEMFAFSLLLALPSRITVTAERIDIPGDKRLSKTMASRMDILLLHSIFDLASEQSPQHYYQKLTCLVAQLMEAEVCLLIMPPKTGGQLIVSLGYNLVAKQAIEGFTVDGRQMPSLMSAVQKGSALRLDGNQHSAEVGILTDELGMEHTSHLLEVPITPRGSSIAMGLVVLSRLSYPVWNEKDESQLLEIVEKLVSTIPKVDNNITNNALKTESEKYHQAYTRIKAQYDQLTSQLNIADTPIESLTEFLERQKSLQEKVTQLEVRNRELENLITKSRPSVDEVDQLRHELKAALEDLARMPTTLSKSDQKMLELQLSAMKQLDDIGQIELVNSIAQEFRQPISSISGYTDLLLGESIGILGAMQRKFLERVKAATERLGILMNELVQVLMIDGGKLDLTQTEVDLKAAVDEAIENITAQISERNICLQVDMIDKGPAIMINKDALQQILANLLENACLVTPADGEIRLSAKVEHKENEPTYLLISMTDQGGGINRADLPRIFSRRYKMENPMIAGIGDTGVGLSIVKSLVELNKGRVWVDSKEGIGSTFSCVIPIVVNPQ